MAGGKFWPGLLMVTRVAHLSRRGGAIGGTPSGGTREGCITLVCEQYAGPPNAAAEDGAGAGDGATHWAPSHLSLGDPDSREPCPGDPHTLSATLSLPFFNMVVTFPYLVTAPPCDVSAPAHAHSWTHEGRRQVLRSDHGRCCLTDELFHPLLHRHPL